MFRVGLPSAVDHDGIASFEQRTKFTLTKGEEKVALADEIDQLFQLVGISEVPHRHPKHNQIGSLEASRKTLNTFPNRCFRVAHCFLRDPLVLRSDCLAVELRQTFLPDVQVAS